MGISPKGYNEAVRLKAIIAERGLDPYDPVTLRSLLKDLPKYLQDAAHYEATKRGITPEHAAGGIVLMLFKASKLFNN